VSAPRPDLVHTEIFRVVDGRAEVLLLHRSPGERFEGLWQGATGGLEPGETIVQGALRELEEETGFGAESIEAFYHLDLVVQFYSAEDEGLLTSALFAVRVRPGTDPRLSHEHDEGRWLPLEDAHAMAVWPAYRESIERVRDCLLDPERATWFELTLDGRTRRR
jgi:8-oxo-dGTP pyrophosphatase MutT (NUDIX family)